MPSFFCLESHQIPESLLPKHRPPSKLWFWCRRDPKLWIHTLQDTTLAIVGTRRASARSLLLMSRVIEGLKNSKLTIASGLAKGVDAYAHDRAIHNGLRTIAFLGTGIHQCYPKENRQLHQTIAESDGAVISEWNPDEPPMPHQFVLRNRLIASFSKAVWIVEAKKDSGSLGTAKFAFDQGRALYATPSFPGDPSFLGCESLLREPVADPLWSSQSFSNSWVDLMNHGDPLQNGDELTKRIFEKIQIETNISLEKIHRWADEWAVHPAAILERISLMNKPK